MKQLILTLAVAASLAGSALAQTYGTADEYWAARGWYREEGSRVYQREPDRKTQAIMDANERIDAQARENKQQAAQLRRVEAEQRETRELLLEIMETQSPQVEEEAPQVEEEADRQLQEQRRQTAQEFEQRGRRRAELEDAKFGTLDEAVARFKREQQERK